MTVTETATPMSVEEVSKLKTINATASEKSTATQEMVSKDPETETIDGLTYPKGTKVVTIAAGEKVVKEEEAETEGFYPDHADFDYIPKLEAKKDRKPKFFEKELYATEGSKTVFPRDDRRVINSTAYPWRCVGRVESPIGFASGVMIGPRHLLTCAHIIDWRPNGTTGWIKFSPTYYNGSVPYGLAYGIRTYQKLKVAGPTIDSTEIQYDYVVVVLDRYIGNTTGWLGVKSYTDAWDGKPWWTHVGYPMDITGGQRPTFETGIALDGDFWSADDNQSMTHKGDVAVGQSGGPFWAYWDGKPCVVAVQSAHNPSINFASGGSDMVDLVIRARAEYP